MATPGDDHSEQSFFFPEFIAAVAPLDDRSAMEYFTFSPWYRTEPPSNNQILRMQNVGNENMADMNETEELRKFTGIEFAVVHSQPPSLFIIHKRERLSPDEVRPLEVYYLVNNRVQQSPNLYALITNRMNASLHALVSSMSILRQHKPSFTPKKGHVWPVSFDPTSAFATSSSRKPVDTTSGGEDGVLQVADTPMDTSTPARAGSVTQGESSQPILTAGGRSQMVGASTNLVTLPLLQAIRTTAVHTLATSPLPPTSTNGFPQPDANPHPTRKIRNVMEVAQATSPPSSLNPQQSQRTMSPAFPSIASISSPYVRTAPTPGVSLSDLRKISTPGTQVPSPIPSEAGTPGGLGGEKKKKRKRTVGPGDTPVSAQSPTFPPPA